jgi:sigma-B regulation protein RsbU (phosphoserine phosphatase)
MFVTAFFGVIDPRVQSFTYVNAGHNPPMVFSEKNGLFHDLEPTGIAFGLSNESVYLEQTLPLNPGDLIILYTDGVTEAMNAKDELFGEERLRNIISQNCSLSSDAITKKILEEIVWFSSGEPQSDDITLLVVKVL